MARREYRKLIIEGLAGYASWEEDISYEMADEDAIDFFNMMVEVIRDNLSVKDTKDSVAKAFAEAQLSPSDPFNWLRLLQTFADAHYGRKQTEPYRYDAAFRRNLWDHLKTALAKQSKINVRSALREIVAEHPAYVSDGEKPVETVDRLQSAIKDFGWTRKTFDHPSPPSR